MYGVERFVERCTRSLMEQTLSEGIEYIFVDDATPDKSIEILRDTVQEYPGRTGQVKILRHDTNRGLPTARNTGMDAARGEYVVHIDSDDFVEPDMLEVMLDEARRTDADMVWCDWYLSGETGERAMPQPDAANAREALRAMMGGSMKYNVWNKMTRRAIFTENKLRFPDGQPMGEDMTMIMTMAHCRNVGHVTRALYHYRRTNEGAMTQTYTDASLEQLRRNADRVTAYLETTGMADAQDVSNFRLQVKFPFLFFEPATRGFRLWREWWPEANAAIGRDRYLRFHARAAQRMASWRLWWGVRLYRRLLELARR